ncbi:hypothetical protein BDZ85DRAFT_286010 [Elsinoe ampelina]|uniref:Uncharacterized protein n=1 Tax=Elsinoe ampelina TaxID=302913 RepID=A0A6A6FZI2_9PEZI|nr:hypothetical protein BDZ85DRAFT_286010 [Elsinoe ampelina]
MPVENDISKERATPNTNQKKFRKHRFHHAAAPSQVDIVLFSKTEERNIPPRSISVDDLTANWHVLPPEVRDMVFTEYFASINQLYHILSTPFPSILRISQEFRQRGLLAFFKQSRFVALLFRHDNENDNFTLPWHRKHASHWLNLPEGPFYMQDLIIRAVVSRCNGCSNEKLQDADSPHCHQLHQIAIRLCSRKKDTELDEYWNRQIKGPRLGQPVYNSFFQHKQATIYLGHRHLVKRDVLRTAIVKVVEDLFGDKRSMEVQKYLENVCTPATVWEHWLEIDLHNTIEAKLFPTQKIRNDPSIRRWTDSDTGRRRARRVQISESASIFNGFRYTPRRSPHGPFRFPFTKLPPEIRVMVYKFYFRWELVLVQKPSDSALLRASRLLRQEARPYFFSNTTFVIYPHQDEQHKSTLTWMEKHEVYAKKWWKTWSAWKIPTNHIAFNVRGIDPDECPMAYRPHCHKPPMLAEDDRTFLYLRMSPKPVLYHGSGTCPICEGLCHCRWPDTFDLELYSARFQQHVTKHVEAMRKADSEISKLFRRPITAANIRKVRLPENVMRYVARADSAEDAIIEIWERAVVEDVRGGARS